MKKCIVQYLNDLYDVKDFGYIYSDYIGGEFTEYVNLNVNTCSFTLTYKKESLLVLKETFPNKELLQINNSNTMEHFEYAVLQSLVLGKVANGTSTNSDGTIIKTLADVAIEIAAEKAAQTT